MRRTCLMAGLIFTVLMSAAAGAGADSGVLLKNFDREFARLQKQDTLGQEDTGQRELCRLDDFGLTYLCDPRWIVEKQDDLTLIVVSNDPLIIITVRYSDPKIKFLVQMNKVYFQERSWYLPGFQTESAIFAGRDAIRVKAFPSDNPQVRVTDYYFMNRGRLTSVFFSVFPKERFEEAKFRVKALADSFMAD